MKYFSELLNRVYNSEEECIEAEEKHKKALAEAEEKRQKAVAEAKAKKEALANERAERAKKIEELYKAAAAAEREYKTALNDFIKDYGSFHATFKTTDPFFSILDWF